MMRGQSDSAAIRVDSRLSGKTKKKRKLERRYLAKISQKKE